MATRSRFPGTRAISPAVSRTSSVRRRPFLPGTPTAADSVILFDALGSRQRTGPSGELGAMKALGELGDLGGLEEPDDPEDLDDLEDLD